MKTYRVILPGAGHDYIVKAATLATAVSRGLKAFDRDGYLRGKKAITVTVKEEAPRAEGASELPEVSSP